jgi:hypothetical protein
MVSEVAPAYRGSSEAGALPGKVMSKDFHRPSALRANITFPRKGTTTTTVPTGQATKSPVGLPPPQNPIFSILASGADRYTASQK